MRNDFSSSNWLMLHTDITGSETTQRPFEHKAFNGHEGCL
jgi:hypothetical protein